MRTFIVRVCDQHGKGVPQWQRMISVVPSTLCRQAYESLELARFKLMTVRLLTFASTPQKDATEIHDFDVTIENNEAMLTAMHVPNASMMCFGVRANAAAAHSHPTNAMAALMHHGRAAYARTTMLSSDEVAGWFTGENVKGQLAQRTCSFLERIDAGFFASNNTHFRGSSQSAVSAKPLRRLAVL